MAYSSGTILLLRHGETEWNREGRYQGSFNSPLTGRGREQALALGSLLARHFGGPPPPLSFQVSPQGRARETAALVARRVDLGEPAIEPRLREVALGALEGKVGSGLNTAQPDGQLRTSRLDHYFGPGGGETYPMALARARSWLDEMVGQGAVGEGLVVAVSHGLTGRILRGAYLGLDPEAALALPVPQDVIWRLAEGRITALEPSLTGRIG